MKLYWLRKRELHEEYGVPWLTPRLFLMLRASFPDKLMDIAIWAHPGSTTTALALVKKVVYFSALSVAASPSRQYRSNLLRVPPYTAAAARAAVYGGTR